MRKKNKLITPEELNSALEMMMPADKARMCRCVEYDYAHTVGYHEAMGLGETERKNNH